MGLWENSVDLALEKGDLELAKVNADMPEDDIQLRKKLWLKIAKYVVQDKQDIKMYVSMSITSDTNSRRFPTRERQCVLSSIEYSD